jgi:nicotinamide mononucleotide adenylyltransferase
MNNHDSTPALNGLTSSHELRSYSLPTNALTTKLGEKDRGRLPLACIACGSFSPPTYCTSKLQYMFPSDPNQNVVHLRMFEMAKDWARKNTNYVVVGAYLSPVGDAYKKKGLAPADHRVRMCELATNTADQKSKFIMVDPWEALQSRYQPTAQVCPTCALEIPRINLADPHHA